MNWRPLNPTPPGDLNIRRGIPGVEELLEVPLLLTTGGTVGQKRCTHCGMDEADSTTIQRIIDTLTSLEPGTSDSHRTATATADLGMRLTLLRGLISKVHFI